MSCILIRCDASLLIGSGHVIRCRTLARELKRQGNKIIFLCRRQPGDLINLLKNEFQVITLPKQTLTTTKGIEGRHLYEAWLGCSQEKDATECLEACTQASLSVVNWLVVDHYGLDEYWEGLLLEGLTSGGSPPKLCAIDDLANRQHRADILLDQNFFGEQTHKRYKNLLPDNCRQLLGPYYALLGTEYGQLHPLVPRRNELKRVLVFFGGIDPSNMTGRALEALLDPALADLEVDVVLGHQSNHRRAVEKMVEMRPKTNLHDPLPSLAGLIARADLAIGAGGATTWERACLGLPSLIVAIAENQLTFGEALHDAGHVNLLGNGSSVTKEQIRSAVLSEISKNRAGVVTTELTDGKGTQRLAMAMIGIKGEISVRTAISRDEGLLLHWSNDPHVRNNSYSPALIEVNEHHLWFQKGLKNPNRIHLICMEENGCPIGQIRFDRQAPSAGTGLGKAAVDLSMDRCARGHGLAHKLIQLGVQEMSRQWGPANEAIAEVFTSNRASNASFARAGFTCESELQSDSHPQTWPINRWRWRAPIHNDCSKHKVN